MEISPIPGIRSLPVMKTPPADSDVSRVFDIVNSSKPDDDTYSGSNKSGAGGEDEENIPTEETDISLSVAPAAANEENPEAPVPHNPALGVNYFA